MGRKKQSRELYVYMNGVFVGALIHSSLGHLTFTYDKEWLSWSNSRPISLSMPLTEIPYQGNIVSNYFENLLPDSELIRERIQARFNASSKRCFDLLSSIGGDCVGALQLLTQSKIDHIKTIQAVPLNDLAIATLLKNYKTAPLGMARTNDFRISIAGAQEKTALLWHQNQWCLPTGTTPTTHIIKLPIGYIQHAGIDLSQSIENEWLCLKILSAFDISVNCAEIMNFEDVKTLVIERFDRRWSDDNKWIIRLPQEDLCQTLGKPPGLKYESDGGPGIVDIMTILLGSQNANHDRKIFMKSVFLFWILGAIDGHAKNFSIKIGPQGRYQLTPLYDVISAYPIANKHQMEWNDLKMAMALKGKNRHYLWKDIQLRHWLSMTEHCQFSKAMMLEIIEEVFDKLDNVIHNTIQLLPSDFPADISNSIFSGMRKARNRAYKSK